MQAGSHSTDAAPSVTQRGLPATDLAIPSQSEAAPDSKATPAEVIAQPREKFVKSNQHINFWHEDELKTAHPEVKV